MNSNGVVEGGYYSLNIDRYQVLNDRIADRNIPSEYLQSYFSNRPVSTKYSKLPVVDQYKQANVPLVRAQPYNVGKIFNPGNGEAPWSGYASNVDVETILRNQAFALQKGDRAAYIPSSKSDLYNVEVVGRQEQQQFPGLFSPQILQPFNPNKYNLAQDVFYNATRQQLKNVTM
jgi:hypothetical protein